jgi:hydroxymethylbilane synthase
VSPPLKLGTRGSDLARSQAGWVCAALAAHGVAVELVIVRTRGDAEVDRPLHELEGKGFFTKELEDALLAGRIDVAVHSLKDLPTQLPEALALAAVPPRADPGEVLVARAAGVHTIADLPAGARIGTSSLRRVAQLRYLRPDLEIVALRGNVPTRLRKVREGAGGLAAALLAEAGLERLALTAAIAGRLDPLEVMPAPGQGALGLELRSDDARARDALAPLEHPPSAQQVAAERSLLAALEGGCQAPVAAYCRSGEDRGATGAMGGGRLFGRVTARDGSVQLTASAALDARDPAAAGRTVADLLRAQGASRLLGR